MLSIYDMELENIPELPNRRFSIENITGYSRESVAKAVTTELGKKYKEFKVVDNRFGISLLHKTGFRVKLPSYIDELISIINGEALYKVLDIVDSIKVDKSRIEIRSNRSVFHMARKGDKLLIADALFYTGASKEVLSTLNSVITNAEKIVSIMRENSMEIIDIRNIIGFIKVTKLYFVMKYCVRRTLYYSIFNTETFKIEEDKDILERISTKLAILNNVMKYENAD